MAVLVEEALARVAGGEAGGAVRAVTEVEDVAVVAVEWAVAVAVEMVADLA